MVTGIKEKVQYLFCGGVKLKENYRRNSSKVEKLKRISTLITMTVDFEAFFTFSLYMSRHMMQKGQEEKEGLAKKVSNNKIQI